MKIFLCATLLLAAVPGMAQHTVYNKFYRQNWQLVNPAAMDRWQFFANRVNSTVLITGGFRQQWFASGLGDAAPQTAFTSVDWAPSVNSGTDANNPIRLGIMTMGDRTDALGTVSFYGNFTYYLQLNRQDFLHFGISGGFVTFGVVGDLRAQDPGDLTIANTGDLGKNYADFSLGIFYRKGKQFYAGLSIPNTFAIKKTDDLIAVERATPIYLVLGSFIEMGDRDYGRTGSNRKFIVEPSLWVRYAAGVLNYNITTKASLLGLVSVDGDLRLYWRETLWGGAGYSTDQMANVEFGVIKTMEKGNRFRIGLSYGYPMGQRFLNLGQSLEITFSYGIK